MKSQSLLFMAAQDRARSPFLWAVALRIRQQSIRRQGVGHVGPVPETVMELSPRRCLATTQN
jgi:hypothetical protein